MGTAIQTHHMSSAAFREVDLKGVWRYANTYPEAMNILQSIHQGSKIPDLRKIITHTFHGLESVPEAFQTAGSAADKSGKLVVKVLVQT